MNHLFRSAIIALLMLPLPLTAALPERFDKITISTIPITNKIHMLRGDGGNIGVFEGDNELLLIDGQFAPLGNKIKAALNDISQKPVRYLINTHYHSDHTSGNATFLNQEVNIIAHETVRNILSNAQGDSENSRLETQSRNALPNITLTDELTLHLGEETIELIHFPEAHSEGDVAVFFIEANVIHTGDLYFAGVTPFIDVAHGGSYEGYLKAMEAILARANETTKIIPGHGPLATKAMMENDYAALKEFDPTQQ